MVIVGIAIATLIGCGDAARPATTITGVQVVAIETTPPQPLLTQNLTIETWVADGRGYGADVLVWMCFPLDGTCVESRLPDVVEGVSSAGVPLALWTRVGRAAPVFETEVAWPFLQTIAADLAGAADTGLGGVPEALLVWALACVPGACPIVDAVMADPVAGSDAWDSAVADLSDPTRWLEDLPPGEASIAVKTVPLWDPSRGFEAYGTFTGYATANQKPFIDVLDPVDLPEESWIHRFTFGDPDPEDVLVERAFTTSGTVLTETNRDGTLTVVRQPPVHHVDRPDDVFLVVDDGRGGTAVWSSAVPSTGRCDERELTPQRSSGGVIQAGDGLDVLRSGETTHVTFSIRGSGYDTSVSSVSADVSDQGTLIGRQPGIQLNVSDCTAVTATTVVLGAPTLEATCALGGRLVDIVLDDALGTRSVTPVVLKLSDTIPCAN